MIYFNFSSYTKFCIVYLSVLTGIYGCGGGGGGGTSTTFLGESPTLTYNASLDATWTARQEYKNVAQYISDSTIHPYTLIGVNYAYGMGLSGSGKTIAILDTEFKNSADSTHGEFSGKTITRYGTLSTSGGDSSEYHGVHVSGLAAAGYHSNSANYVTQNTNTSDWSTLSRIRDTSTNETGGYNPLLNYGMMGVAYNADLHLTDFSTNLTNLGLATTSAKNAGAIVQNNSWGWGTCQRGDCYHTIDVWVNYQKNNGTTDAETLGALSDTETGWKNYLSALDNFQTTGVVVVSAGNDPQSSQVNVQAGLPQIATELAESWLVVGNIDIDGPTVTSSSVIRKGNQCGVTAQYCVQADGTQLTSSVGGWGGSSETGMYQNYTGTSMSAPVVSGAIALLSEAFPNHTPAQLVDRILASANNDFFTTTDTTSFANGITHGYNSEFGHGIVDLEGALKPIKTSSIIPPSGPGIETTGNINTAQRFDVTATRLNLSPAFGDSLKRALTGKTTYFYDGLNGGFAFDFGSLVGTSTKRNTIKFPVDYITHGPRVKTAENSLGFTVMASPPSAPEAKGAGLLMLVPVSKNTIGFAGENINIQNALSFSENDTVTTRPIESGNPFSIPFIRASEHGSVAGIKSGYFAGNLSLGIFDGDPDKHQLPTSGFIVSYEVDVDSSKISAFSGATMENDGFLETSIEGAFAEKSFANTRFAGFLARGSLPGTWHYGVMGTFGHTDLEIDGAGLLDDVKDVFSTAFALEIQRPIGFTKNDMLHFGVSQPMHVETGTASIYLPQLYDTSGNMRFKKMDVGLEPSGRQIDFGVGYTASLSERLFFGIQSTLTRDAGHIQSNALDYSVTSALKLKF